MDAYLGVSGSGGSITFCVIHDSTIRANHTLHRSHLVAWPTRGSALCSKRGEKENISNSQLQTQLRERHGTRAKNRQFIWAHKPQTQSTSRQCNPDLTIPFPTSNDPSFKQMSFKNQIHEELLFIYIALSFFHCSQVRGYYPAFSSASLPPLKQGQTCVAATSTTIWPRFIKQLQIYLNMRTSSGGGHKNVSHFLGGCSVLCAHTNGAEHAYACAHACVCVHACACSTHVHTHTACTVYINPMQRFVEEHAYSAHLKFLYIYFCRMCSVSKQGKGKRKRWGA